MAITKMSGSSKLSEKRSSSYCRLDLGLKSRHAVAANLVHKPLFDPSAWLSSEIYLHTQTQQANGRHCFASSCDACFTKSFFFSVRKSPQTKFRNTEKNKIYQNFNIMEVVEKPPATDILFATYPSGCRSLSQRPYAEFWVEVTGAASPGLTTPAGAPSAISSPPARHPVWVPVQKNNAQQLFMSSLDSQQIHSKRLLLRLCCLLLRFAFCYDLMEYDHTFLWQYLQKRKFVLCHKDKVCALPDGF